MGVRWYHLLVFSVCVLGLAFLSLPEERAQGLLFMRDKAYSRAIPYLRSALQREPDDETVREAFVRAVRLAGAPTQAANEIEALLAHRPHDPSLIAALAELRLAAGRYEEALLLLRRIARTIVDEERILDLYESMNALDEAVAFLQARTRRGAESLPRLERLARLHRWRQNLDEQLEVLKTIARQDPQAQRCAAVLELALWLDRWKDARIAAARIVANADAPLECLRMARQFFRRDRQVGKWREISRRVCQDRAAEAEDWQEYAFAVAYGGDSQEQLTEIFDEAMRRFPTDANLARHFMWLSSEMGWRDLAAAAAETVAARTGFAADWREAAQIMWDIGKRAQARAILDERGGGREGPTRAVAVSGQWAWEMGDLQTALGRAKTLDLRSRAAPVDLEAAEAALRLYRGLGRQEEERLLLSHLVQRSPSGKWLCDLADLCLAANDAANAIALLGEKPPADADAKRWRRLRGLALWQRAAALPVAAAERASALSAAHAALAASLRDSKDSELLQIWVECCLALGRAMEAWQATADATLPPWLWLTMAEKLLDAGQRPEAEAALARVAIAGLTLDELQWAAFLHEKAGRLPDALHCLERAQSLAPDNDAVILLLADAYGRAGEREKQYALMEQRAVQNGEKAWLDAADRRLWNNDHAGEEETLRRGLARHPQSLPLRQRRLQALVRLRRYDEAMAEWEVIYQHLADMRLITPEIALDVARLAVAAGHGAEAIDIYHAYLEKRPADGWAWYDLAGLLISHKRDSRQALAKAWEYLPADTALALAARSRVRFWQGNPNEAVRLMAEAIAHGGDDVELLCEAADLHLNLRQTSEAERLLARAAALQPKSSRVQRLQAWCLLQRRQPAAAADLLRQLLAAQPEDKGLALDLANALAESGKWREAREIYRQIIAATGEER